ncbi:MAG: hypothetical protein WAO71_05625 [Gallionella sp.]
MAKRISIWWLLLSVATIVLSLLPNSWMGIRFESDLLNGLFELCIWFTIPSTILLGCYAWLSGITRWVTLSALSLIFVVFLCVPIYLTTSDVLDIAETGQDRNFEEIDDQMMRGHHYRLYRANWGSTTKFALVLRQESEPFLGMKRVSVIKTAYPASDAKLEIMPSGLARLTIQPYGDGKQLGEIFEFKPE